MTVLGKRVAIVDPKERSMHEVVGIMTGAVVHDLEHPGNGDEPAQPRGDQAPKPGAPAE